MSYRKACPRCEKRGLKTWAELSDDEREVIRRLPKSAAASEEERKITSRWCTRCWFEESHAEEHA